MRVRQNLPYLMVLPVVTGAAVLGQSGVARASELAGVASQSSYSVVSSSTTPDRLDELTAKYGAAGKAASVESDTGVEAATAAVVNACNSSDAVEDVTYTVDGKTLTELNGNTHEGSKVVANFKIAEGCDDVEVGLASYEAPGATWDPATADQQKLVGHQSGKFAADGSVHSLEVDVSDCYYQVDFFTGPVLEKLTSNQNYSLPNMNLIDADNGGTKTCEVPSPPVDTPTEVTPTAETPTEVLAVTVQPPQSQLAATGSDTTDLVMIGSALTLLGAALGRASKRVKVRRQA